MIVQTKPMFEWWTLVDIRASTSGLMARSVIGGIAQATNLTVSFLVVTLLTCGMGLAPYCARRSAWLH